MLKSLNVKKAHLFVLYMAGGLFLWHRNDYLNDIVFNAHFLCRHGKTCFGTPSAYTPSVTGTRG